MAISQNFPSVRPSLDLNFAGTEKLDSRITFSRGSAGTYYDGNGVLQTATPHVARFDHDPVTGESLGLLVEEQRTNATNYSTFMPSAIWGIAASTIVIPNATLAPDGTFTAHKCTIASTASLDTRYQLTRTNGVGGGNPCTFSFFVKKAEARYLQFGFHNYGGLVGSINFDLDLGTFTNGGFHPSYVTSSASIIPISNGWYRCSISVGSDVGGNVWFYPSNSASINPSDGVSGVFLWGFQGEIGNFPTTYIPTPATFTGRSSTATFYDSSGIIRTAASGFARSAAFFPDSSGVMRPAGLLLEAAATNLVGYSEQFDNAAWSKGGATISANVTTAPDGTSTADKLVEDTSTGAHGIQSPYIAQNNSVGSIFIKPAGRTRVLITNFGDPNTAIFDLTGLGTVVSGPGSIQLFPNGWYRCSVRAGSSITYGYYVINLISSGTTVSYLGDGTSGVFLWGAQIETGTYATSYIPTVASTVTRAADTSTSSAVTRNADSAFMTGTNFTSWYNYSQGALYIESQNDYNASIFSHAGTGVEIHSNAFQSNMLSFNSKRDSPSYPSPWFNIFSRGDGIGAIGNGRIGSGSNRISGSVFYKSSFSWSFINSVGVASTVTTVATSADGTTTSSATSATVTSPPVTTLGFATNNYAYNGFSGRIKRLTYWPETIPNSILQQITR